MPAEARKRIVHVPWIFRGYEQRVYDCLWILCQTKIKLLPIETTDGFRFTRCKPDNAGSNELKSEIQNTSIVIDHHGF